MDQLMVHPFNQNQATAILMNPVPGKNRFVY